MKKSMACLVGLIALSFSSSGQNLNLAFYNVENLFHPSVDSINPDREFTAEGSKKWDTAKYYHKLNQVSKVILALSDTNFEAPALVGFAEVESAKVLDDLRKRPALRKIDYQWVHYDSPDRRGIDLGLLYRKDLLRLIYSEAIPYRNESEEDYRSRDMLHAQFAAQDFDFHLFLCHWPSRYGGKKQSEARRLAAASILRNKVDSLGPEAKVIIMGDFNDEAQDSSLSLLDEQQVLINLMSDLDPQWGSHRYRGDWAYLDQILLSSNLQNRLERFGVLKADFLLEKDSKYPGPKPKRSFKGNFYQGGFSDHLPIFIELQQGHPTN